MNLLERPGGTFAQFRLRANGIVVRQGSLLLVRQQVSDGREWSLPGGHVEAGESVEEACVREVFEETGIQTELDKLLYVAERFELSPPLFHVTFRMSCVGSDEPRMPQVDDEVPILAVRFVPICALDQYGFSDVFCAIANADFPPIGTAGAYVGPATRLGL